MARDIAADDHCDYSFLPKDWCAHCQKHTLEPDLELYAQQLAFA